MHYSIFCMECREEVNQMFLCSCVQLFITFYRRHNITHIGHFSSITPYSAWWKIFFRQSKYREHVMFSSYMAEFWNISKSVEVSTIFFLFPLVYDPFPLPCCYLFIYVLCAVVNDVVWNLSFSYVCSVCIVHMHVMICDVLSLFSLIFNFLAVVKVYTCITVSA